MTVSIFASVAAEVQREISNIPVVASTDRDAEWQRVNSYIADVLKDSHVLYAKLARLQGDFTGHELRELEKISEDVLSVGEMLSHFSKNFYDGKINMADSQTQYGDDGGGGGGGGGGSGGSPQGPHGDGGNDHSDHGRENHHEESHDDGDDYDVPVEVQEEEGDVPPPPEDEDQGQ